MTKSNQQASSASAAGAGPVATDDDRARGLVDASGKLVPVAMPAKAGFKYALLARHIHARSRRKSKSPAWRPRLLHLKINPQECYTCHGDDINNAIPASSNNPQKVWWVDLRRALHAQPWLADHVSDDFDATCLDDIDEPVVEKRVVKQIVLADDERFVGADGQPSKLRMYCERNAEGVRTNVDDLMSFYGIQRLSDHKLPGSFDTEDATDADTGEDIKITDYFGFVIISIHARNQGSENAEAVMLWMVRTLYAAHLGDGQTVRPAMAAILDAGDLPIEFGQRVCGTYAFAIVKGDRELVARFPAIQKVLDRNGIDVDSEWYLVKIGHTGCASERVSSLKCEYRRTFGPRFAMSHGCFWATPVTSVAQTTERALQDGPYEDFNVVPDGTTWKEIFALPAHMLGAPMRALGDDAMARETAAALTKADKKTDQDKNKIEANERKVELASFKELAAVKAQALEDRIAFEQKIAILERKAERKTATFERKTATLERELAGLRTVLRMLPEESQERARAALGPRFDHV